MNQTNPKLIFLIVISVAILAAICVTSLCASLFLHVYADPSVLTAIIGTTGLLIGALVTMLSNTRSASSSGQTTVSSTTTTSTPTLVSSTPQPVIVVNDPANPADTIPVADQTKPTDTPPAV